MIPTWLRSIAKLLQGKTQFSRRRRRTYARRPSFRPLFEQFEQRLVPTTINIPTNLGPVVRGATIQVPIKVDTLNDLNSDPNVGQQQGLSGGGFVVWYNPAVLSLNVNTDISLGTIGDPTISSSSGSDGYSAAIPNGWTISAPTPPIRVRRFSAFRIPTAYSSPAPAAAAWRSLTSLFCPMLPSARPRLI